MFHQAYILFEIFLGVLYIHCNFFHFYPVGIDFLIEGAKFSPIKEIKIINFKHRIFF